MRRFVLILIFVSLIGAYLHYVRGIGFGGIDVKELTDSFYRDALQVLPKKEEKLLTGTRWEERAPMRTARSEIGAALIGGRIYVVGGLDGYGRTLRSMEIYDIATDTWSDGPQMPQALHHPAVATDGEKLYVVGGLFGITFKTVDTAYVYDPAGRAWKELGRLNDFRGAATAGFIGGRLVVTGGVDLAGPTGTTEAYDAETDSWEYVATMPTPREHLASAVFDGKLHVAAGRTHFPDGNVAAFEALTLDADGSAWRKLMDVPTPRSGFAMTAADGRLFVFGGEGPDGTIAPVEAYDPRVGKWLPFGHLPTPRHGLAAVADGNRIYVIGGGRRTGWSVSDLNEVLIIE